MIFTNVFLNTVSIDIVEFNLNLWKIDDVNVMQLLTKYRQECEVIFSDYQNSKTSDNNKLNTLVYPDPPEIKHQSEGSFLHFMKQKKYTNKWLMKNCIVSDNYYFGRKYIILEVNEDVTAFSEIDKNDKRFKGFPKKYKSIADF